MTKTLQGADRAMQNRVTKTGGAKKDKKPFWVHQSELHIANGLLMKGQTVVIPEGMQTEMLMRLHEGHMGISKCRSRAQQSVWWLGLSSQIAKMVAQCETCLRHQPQHTEPMIPSPLPGLPWQKLGADLFFQGTLKLKRSPVLQLNV